MTHNIAITSADGQTGHLIAELLLTDQAFTSKLGDKTLTVMTFDEAKTADLAELGATVVPVKETGTKAARSKALVAALQEHKVDTICLIPPARKNKVALTTEFTEAAKKAGVQNVLLLSAAGCDYAEADEQPVLRSFIELERLVLEAKGDADVPLGHSPCIIRAGLYAETLLLIAKQAQTKGVLALPIGPSHKIAPVALGDVALLAAHILTGEGPQGFDDKHRGQLFTQTGPILAAGEEIVTAIKDSIGVKLEFKDIDPEKAKKEMTASSDLDASEVDLLFEYYALARQGKLNYVSTIAGAAVTGQDAQELTEFFKTYDESFQRKRKRSATGSKEEHKDEKKDGKKQKK